jgi:predicted DNA-binding protein (UPF0251 family)
VPRRRRCRRVGFQPHATWFRPVGTIDLVGVNIALEEIEAIRLKDLEGLDQEEAARSMGISQPTFHRILESARWKVAQAIIEGKPLHIGGGTYKLETTKRTCDDCEHGWEEEHSAPSPLACVVCGSKGD